MDTPELVVFDLDFTLWDCGGTWCDCLSPPFVSRQGDIADRQDRRVRLYDDVHGILNQCDRAQIPMALASRTEQPAWASELLRLLEVTHRFAYAEIYPSSKQKHFAALRQISNIEYNRMLFFDDEMRNITEVSRLGVTCVYVENGINDDLFRQGLAQCTG